MTSVTTHVYSALSIISSVPIILAVPVFPVSAVYFSVSSVSMLLLCFFLICIRVPTTATGLALMSKTIFLVAGLIAIKEWDIVCSHTCPQRGACKHGQSWAQLLLEWNQMQNSIPLSKFGNMWPSLHTGSKNISKLLHYLQTWIHVWVSHLPPLT